jgi:hypothetical protein
MTHGAAAGQRAAEWSRSPFFAATAAAVLPGVTIIVTWRRIKSAAMSGNWSFLPEAQRYSIATHRPLNKAGVGKSPPEGCEALGVAVG